MTKEQIQKLRDLIAPATPGPWRITRGHDDFRNQYRIEADHIIAGSQTKPKMIDYNDAALIAEARTALPSALDEIERLQKDYADLATEFNEYKLGIMQIERNYE